MYKKGFTLTELIVVIVILSVLGLVLITQVVGYSDSAKNVTCLNNRQLIQESITVIEASGITDVATLDELATIPTSLYQGGKVCPEGNQNIAISNRKVTCKIHNDTQTGGGQTGGIEDGKGFCLTLTTQEVCTNMSIRDFSEAKSENPNENSIWYFEDNYYFFRAGGGWFGENPTRETILGIINSESSIKINNEKVVVDYVSAKEGDLAMVGGKLKIFTGYGGNPSDTSQWREIDVSPK